MTRELISVTNTTVVNTATMCELLRRIAALGLTGPLTLVLDNARYQRNAVVQGLATQLGITLLYLPSYSPNLNLIGCRMADDRRRMADDKFRMADDRPAVQWSVASESGGSGERPEQGGQWPSARHASRGAAEVHSLAASAPGEVKSRGNHRPC